MRCPCGPQITQLCRINPEVARNYWDWEDSHAGTSDVALFVPNAGASMGTSIPFMTVYLDMLSAMARGPAVGKDNCPWLVYKFVTPTTRTLSARYCPMACTFNRLFATVKAYVELLGPSGASDALAGVRADHSQRMMPDHDTMALMAFLRLVQSLVALPRIREEVVDHKQWNTRQVCGCAWRAARLELWCSM